MEGIFRLVADEAVGLARHPLFSWFREAAIPAERRLDVLPALAMFSMAYRDVCEWVIRYPEPVSELQAAINAHTDEDVTHSLLFLDDWQALKLDERLAWTASDVLWWLFLADDTKALRRAGMKLFSMRAADGDDPLLRCAWAEVVEACGAVFFAATTEVIAKGSPPDDAYRYLGRYHLDRESGHIESGGAFEAQRLTDGQRRRAEALVTSMFDTFKDIFDCMLKYATAYPGRGRLPRAPREIRRSRPIGHQAGRSASLPRAASETAVQLRSQLGERYARTAAHPLYQELRSPSCLPAADRLALLLPEWSMGLMGYRDLVRYALRSPGEEATPVSALSDAWIAELASHSAAYLADWRALGLDSALRWSASETLRWLYMDPVMEVHRRNMALFTHVAATCRSPVSRAWMLEILEASGHEWFATTTGLAIQAERELGSALDYLAGRCEGFRPFGDELYLLPVSQSEYRQVASGIEVVFDAMDQQLDLTLATISQGVLHQDSLHKRTSFPDRKVTVATEEGSWR